MNKKIKGSIKFAFCLVSCFGITLGTAQLAYSKCDKLKYESLLKLKTPGIVNHLDDLMLSKSQNDRLIGLLHDYKDAVGVLLQQKISLRTQVNSLITLPQLDHVDTDIILAKIKDNLRSHMLQTVIFRSKLYNFLNDDQKYKYHVSFQQEQEWNLMATQCPKMVSESLGMGAPADPLRQLSKLTLSWEQEKSLRPLVKSTLDNEKNSMLEYYAGAIGPTQLENQFVQTNGVVDSDKLQALIDQEAEYLSDLNVKRILVYRDIFAALNEQQQAIFSEIINKQGYCKECVVKTS